MTNTKTMSDMTQQDVDDRLKKLVDSIQHTVLHVFLEGGIESPVEAVDLQVQLDPRCVIASSITSYFIDHYKLCPSAFDDAWDRMKENGEVDKVTEVPAIIAQLVYYHLLDEKMDELWEEIGEVTSLLEEGMAEIPNHLDKSGWKALYNKLEAP